MRLKKHHGITLIELLLTIGLAGIILTSITFFIILISDARTKQETILGTEEEGSRALSIITHALRNAESISSPSAGTSADSISLSMSDESKNPTIFSLTDGIIYITEGAGDPVALTSARHQATELLFSNKTPPGAKGSVRAQFTLTRLNPTNKASLSYSKIFYGTGTIK